MNITTITDGICEALYTEFGAGYELYTENVEQGLTEPCFLIRCLNPTKNVDLGARYRRTNQYAIQYFPASTEPIAECYTVCDRLFECLKDITVSGKLIHGAELHGETTDGILTFTVNYDGFVLDYETKPIMEDLNTVSGARKE